MGDCVRGCDWLEMLVWCYEFRVDDGVLCSRLGLSLMLMMVFSGFGG